MTGRAVLRTLSADARAELRYIDVSAPVVPVVRTDTPDAATRVASSSPIVEIAPPEGSAADDLDHSRCDGLRAGAERRAGALGAGR